VAEAAAGSQGDRLFDVKPDLPKAVALGWGIFFTVAGVVFIARTGTRNPFAKTGREIFNVGFNSFLGFIYLALGIGGILCSRTRAASRRFLGIQFKVCILLFVLGMYAKSHPGDNYIAGIGYTMGLNLIAALGATW
jgi:hypothetical protein